ncbi:MAG: class I SAM-dependent methyltransferase [Luteimonas sp.]
MTERGYQLDFARTHPAMYDPAGRERKADTIVAVLSDALGPRLAHARGLNIGCSTGLMDSHVAPSMGHLTGIDIDEAAVEFAQQTHASDKLDFRLGDAMSLDFPDASFDVVLCSQVYEHVPDPQRLMTEIERVLAPGGVCYLSATNRWCVVEQHYFLPFLSWLPQRWADAYLRATGKGDHYYERHLGHGRLRKLVRAFAVDDYTGRLVREPDRFGTAYMIDAGWKRRVLSAWLRVAAGSFPGYIWLLRKVDAAGRADPQVGGR